MEQSTILLVLVVVAAFGLLATIAILRRERTSQPEVAPESPFAAATEGQKRCPNCGTANLVTDRDCMTCGRRLA
jgi:hypothetical protein